MTRGKRGLEVGKHSKQRGCMAKGRGGKPTCCPSLGVGPERLRHRIGGGRVVRQHGEGGKSQEKGFKRDTRQEELTDMCVRGTQEPHGPPLQGCPTPSSQQGGLRSIPQHSI